MANHVLSLTILKQFDKDKHEEITSRFLENEDLINAVKTAINEKISDSFSRMTATSSYNNPSWAYYQADQLGYQRALKELIDLISIKQE